AWQRHADAQTLVLRNLDHQIAFAAYRLAREARTRLEGRRPVEHVLLVFAHFFEALQSFTHDHAAGRAGERAAAVVRKLGALPQQGVEEAFTFGEAQFNGCHIGRTRWRVISSGCAGPLPGAADLK